MKRGEVVKRALLDEEREIRLSEDLWLNFFNQYLFENGTITEKEYKKMVEKIANRKAKACTIVFILLFFLLNPSTKSRYQ